MQKRIGIFLLVVLVASLSFGTLQAQDAGENVLIGAFDVGPGGAPQVRPYMDTAGRTWLAKIWSTLVSWNEDSTALTPQLATEWTRLL
nr:MAG: hypothetical protein DIU68_10900 [Chloroflexota bacterium]